MPQPYPILIEALAQIAASNDSDQISEIARNAARRILSVEAIAMIKARSDDGVPVCSTFSGSVAMIEPAAPPTLGHIPAETGEDTSEAEFPDNPVKRCSKYSEQLPALFGGVSADHTAYGDARDTMVEIIAAQTLASAASSAISRCVNLAALTSARTRLELERDEVRHRLKNVYASAIGLANLSLPKEHSREFAGRLRTLAEVHHFLDGDSDGTFGIPLGEVLAAVLSPYHDKSHPRVMVEGPDIEVNSDVAAALGLLANELATNALKHGSLSVNSGRILVQWTLYDDELGFSWREIGGPEVNCVAAPNQGSKLMRMIIEGQLRGKMAQRLTPTGLLFTALMPIA